MPVKIKGLLEDVENYEGKNGFGANITISTKTEDKKTKRVEINTRNKAMVDILENYIDEKVELIVELIQNRFGTRIGNILDVVVA